MAKRCLDLTCSLIGLLGLAPLLILIGLAVLCIDGRPILFCQERVGWRGKPFRIYKFRTMRNATRSGTGHFEPGNRARITRIGRLLRQTKLDELPQLWNIFCGDMSLVGPRPEVAKWVAAYPDRWDFVLQMKPGLTDPASIQFRNEEELLSQQTYPELYYEHEVLPKKLALYESYVRQQTFWGDLAILVETLKVVCWSRGEKNHA